MLKTLRLCIDLGGRQVEKNARSFRKMQKVLKTPRLCIDLGGRQVEEIAHSFEKYFVFSINCSFKIDENSSPEVRKTSFARKID